jgi:ATP-binding cassette, subfamily B, bacterial PglK
MYTYIKEIFQLLGNERRKLPVMILLFVLASLLDIIGLGLIGPYIALLVDPENLDGALGWFIQALDLPREPKWLLSALGISLIGLYLIKAISAIWVNYVITKFGFSQQVRIRSRLMKTYQSLPYTEYLQRNSAEYVYSIQMMSGHYTSQVVMTLLRLTSDSILGVAILALLAWTNGLALLILMGLLSAMILIYDRIFRRYLRTYGRKSNKAEIAMVKGINEGVEGLKEIRVLGYEAHFYRKVLEGARQYAHCNTWKQVISLAPRYLLEFIMVSFVVLLATIMFESKQNSSELLPTLGVFAFAAMRLLPTVNVFSNSLLQLRFARDAVTRLHQDLIRHNTETLSLRKHLDSEKMYNDPFNILSMQRVSFRYPNTDRDALHKITLEIHAGESIGIIGTSGSGKSTLVDMLLGMLEPHEGGILINGRLMNEKLVAWRTQVAYLPQQIFLIDDTMRRNIALGIEDKDIDNGRISEALRQTRLTDLVDELPEGTETLLGERGVRLSGGQRQRIALARAFYHGRNILVMDEATSALDNETEREIIEEINYFKGKKTMIVIAHRMSTVQQCDRIYRLEQGQIVKCGTPDQILFEKN